jgi:hypothetical protein
MQASACRNTKALDLRVLDLRPDTALTSLKPALTITPENTRPSLQKIPSHSFSYIKSEILERRY